MNDFCVKRFGLILAIQAEIEAMKTENARRGVVEHAQAYEEYMFYGKAEELRVVVAMHEDQL